MLRRILTIHFVLFILLGFVVSVEAKDGVGVVREGKDANSNPSVQPHTNGSNLYGFVGASITDDLAVFDVTTNDPINPPIALLPEGDYPYDATMTPSENEVWVAGATGDGVLVVDSMGLNLTQVITDPNIDYPVDVAFSPSGNTAYVANRNSEFITTIDTSSYAVGDSYTIDSTLASAPDPGKMAIHPTSGDIYIVDWFDRYLFQIDETNGAMLNEMNAGISLWDLVISPDGQKIYVTDRGSDQVHVIDVATFTIDTSIPTGDDPWGIDLSPDGTTLFVANEDDSSVTVIDVTNNSVVTSIALDPSAAPRDVDFRGDGAFVYVPTGNWTGDDGVFVIDTNTLQVVDTVLINPAANSNVIAIMQGGSAPLPIADFDFQPLIPLGTTATFTDTSLFSPTSWAWEFGDGGSSAMQNPTYQYAQAGTYTVTLTVTNDAGMDSISHTVQVGSAPVADFTFALQADNLVQFNDVSTNSPDSWEWNFGDGSPMSTLQNPSHVYENAGTFPTTLTVSNAFGSDSITKNVAVNNFIYLPILKK